MKWDGIGMKSQGRLLQMLVLVLALAAPGVFAQGLALTFTAPTTPVAAGSDVLVSLNALNLSAQPLTWTFPSRIDCRLRLTNEASIEAGLRLELEPTSGAEQIAGGAFARRTFRLTLPDTLNGRVIVEFTALAANPLVLEVQPQRAAVVAAPAPETEPRKKSALAKLLQQAVPHEEEGQFNPGRFFKEHISGYEPFYFIAGTESPNAKFQVSFKYQLLNSEGVLAEKAPVLKGLHMAYTQTSLWDWNRPSAPFLDSSYKPEVLYRYDRLLGGRATNWFQLDLQGGVQHESNGRDGDASRSLNIAYLRPTLTFGKPDGLQLTLQPRAWVYVGDLNDNPDLERYRGHVDLRAVVGWQRGLQLSALGRLGDSGDRGSVQLDLTYPMMRLLSRSFSVYLHAQYFTGYGESLLLYSERSSAWRVGFSLFR